MERIQLFGADNKAGVTMICQCIAETMANRYPEKTIGLFHVDGNPGMSYTAAAGSGGLDTLKAAIMSRVLTCDELLTACSKALNLYHLPGIRDYSRRRIYTPDEADYLLSLDAFDLVVVDCGSNFEMPMALGALRGAEAQNNVLVTTQQAAALEHYKAVQSQILKPLGISFQTCMVNKHISNVALPDADKLSQMYHIPQVMAFPYVDQAWQAEQDSTSLLAFKNLAFEGAMDIAADWASKICGLPERTDRKKKRGWGVFSRRKQVDYGRI